ncbi:hypothetical protein [Hymenobacter amundsenii]|uniref:hypothetical protein n=1 Tax=Hymenobacter amundsenii TaxID=2006685 RepID=UPI000F81F53D|nr:hypothetical protein [Hymenobacter amundsenii]
MQAAIRAQRAAELIVSPPAPDGAQPQPQPAPQPPPSHPTAPAGPADNGALAADPAADPALGTQVLSQQTGPSLTSLVIAAQRSELTRLLEHPAFSDEQRRTATGRILAEADPARLGRWLTNIMQRVAAWENQALAEEARQNPRPHPCDDC